MLTSANVGCLCTQAGLEAPSVERGLVFNIARFSIHDGPGIRTTVFLKGCPLRCWWCHNPESQSSRPEVTYFQERCRQCGDCVKACAHHALQLEGGVRVDETLCERCGTCVDACLADARQIAGKWMSAGEVLGQIERDRVFYEESGGGVTLSGGEPLQQGTFGEILLRLCRARGIHTTVDTCGYTAPGVLERIAAFVDLFLFDIKLIDPQQHREYTGVANDLILSNLNWLVTHNRNVILRVPVIPACTDSDENLSAIVRLARSLGLRRIHLLPYHRIAMDKYQRLGLEYKMGTTVPPSPARMNAIAAGFAREGLEVRIGG